MTTDNKLGANLRALRRAHGISLEDFGGIFGIGKSAVAFYETGKRYPKLEMLHDIATYYMLTVDELQSSDFTKIEPVKYNTKTFKDNITTILPILLSKEAEKNAHFQNAVLTHQQVYEHLQQSDLSVFSESYIEHAIDEYELSLEDDNIKDISLMNVFGLNMLMLYYLITVPHLIVFVDHEINNVIISQAKSQDPTLMYDLVGVQKSDFEGILKIQKSMISQLNMEEIFKGLGEVKKTPYKKLRDVVDYYCGLLFFWGIIDNDLTFANNRQIGREMLILQSNLGNLYAKRFLALQ